MHLKRFLFYGPRADPAILGERIEHCFLNEWIRFDRPSVYTIGLESRRIREPRPENRTRLVRLNSNTVTIEVTAPKAGELEAVLEKALAHPGAPENVNAIRFLNTEASRAVLLDWLIENPDLRHDAGVGLVGDRDRNAVRDLPLDALAKPDFEPSPEFIHILGMVVTDGPAEFPEWIVTGEHDTARKLRRTLISNALDVVRKHVDEQALGVALANVVSALDRDTVWALEHKWNKIRCEALAPQLATWANPRERQYGDHYQPTWAAIRWLEIDPDAARKFILSKLKEPAPLLSEKALGALPDEEIPELDEILLANLDAPGRDYDRVLFAIERYASAAVVESMIERYQKAEGRWACALQASTLRYWIRRRRNAGIEATFRAQTFREPKQRSRCYAGNLSRVLTPFYDEKIEARLLGELEKETDPDVIYDICALLLKKGSPKVVDIVIDQFATIDPADKSPVPRGSMIRDKLRIHLMSAMARRELLPAQVERVRSLVVTTEELGHVLVRAP